MGRARARVFGYSGAKSWSWRKREIFFPSVTARLCEADRSALTWSDRRLLFLRLCFPYRSFGSPIRVRTPASQDWTRVSLSGRNGRHDVAGNICQPLARESKDENKFLSNRERTRDLSSPITGISISDVRFRRSLRFNRRSSQHADHAVEREDRNLRRAAERVVQRELAAASLARLDMALLAIRSSRLAGRLARA